MDRPRNWSTNEPVDCTEVLGQGTKGLQPSGRVPTLPSESLQPVVGLLDMREPLVEVATGSIGVVDYNASSGDPNGQGPSNPGWNLPGALAGTTVQTGPGQHSVGGESTWTSSECSTGSNILDWGNWLSERAYGRCQRTQYFEGKAADGFESSEQAQAYHLHRGDGDSGVGSRGQQLGSGDRDRGCAGQPQSTPDARTPGQRLLVGPDQLGGSIGQSLKKLVPGRSFSSMMILLCLNCSITTEMVGSFGIPISSTSTTASSCGEFVFTSTLHYDTPHKEPFATAYFFEDLGKRVQQSSADLYGLTRAIPRPTRRFLTQEMRKKPKIMEVYSPPRVNQQAKKYGFQAAGSLDLTTGWDFTKASHRKKALALIRELCPVLVILSPPCTTFSQLRNLSNYKRSPQQVEAEEAEGLQHLEFAVQIARLQRRAGRGFLFEHPKSATSWHTPSLARLAALPDVFNVSVDLCRFGLKSLSGLPALKPTLLLTNVESLATVLHRRCDGLHAQHGPLLGGQAHLAAKYTPEFVNAILQGIKQHVQNWIKGRRGHEDYWELLDKAVVRHHRVPRRGLFLPHGVPGCPVSISHLASTRTTVKVFPHNNQKQTLVDDWRTSATPAQCTPHQWTGTTTFPIASKVILPTPWQTAATYLVAATGHPIYAYLDHETAFHTEWKSLFPSRRILGGGAAASENLEPVAEEDFDDDMNLENALDREVDREEDEQQVARALARGEKSAEIGKRLKEQKEKTELEQDSPYLHPELRRELYRVHRNLGHPSLPRFLRALKHAGAKMEVLQWTKTAFHCPICAQNEKKSSYRPAHLQRSLAFNEVVGMDLIKTQDLWMLNMLCWGTNLQFVEVVDDKKAETIYQTFVKAWVAHYGPPTLIVVDQGNEFRDPFASKVNEMGINMHVIDVRSPWQNGRTEKAGGLFKARLEKVIQEATLVTDEEIRTAIYETAAAHNRYYHRSGFSPAQRVFGQNHRLPASLLSDDHLDRNLMVDAASDSMKRAWQIREEAAKAWMKFQDDDAVRRALQARTRTADVKADLRPGALVYVWRDVPYYKGWSGPGTIISETNQGKSLWISLRGYLVKASREQVRAATAEEPLGAELSHVLSAELLQDIETGKIKNYRDVEGEGLPEGEDTYEPSIAPAEDAMEQELELHPHEREEVPPAEGELHGPVDMDVDPAESTAPPPTSEPAGGSRRPLLVFPYVWMKDEVVFHRCMSHSGGRRRNRQVLP